MNTLRGLETTVTATLIAKLPLFVHVLPLEAIPELFGPIASLVGTLAAAMEEISPDTFSLPENAFTVIVPAEAFALIIAVSDEAFWGAIVEAFVAERFG
jgi:hypothetical protein